jgi:hypothetical protein
MPSREPTATEMFETVGRALTGAVDWQGTTAALMNIRRDSVRQLANGRMELKPGHFSDLLSLLVDRQAELKKAEAELRAWLSRQPQED